MNEIAETQAAVREFILTQFPAARKLVVDDHDSLLEQGIVDSMGLLEVVTFIESQFGVTLSDDDLLSDHFETVARIAELVHHKVMEKEHGLSSPPHAPR